MGVAVLFDEPLVGGRLFEGGEVVPKDILDQREFERLPFPGLPLHARHFAEPGLPGGLEAALPRDDLVVLGAQPPHQDRLEDSVLPDGSDQGVQPADPLPGLVRIGVDLRDRNHPPGGVRFLGGEGFHIVAGARLEPHAVRKTGSPGHG